MKKHYIGVEIRPQGKYCAVNCPHLYQKVCPELEGIGKACRVFYTMLTATTIGGEFYILRAPQCLSAPQWETLNEK